MSVSTARAGMSLDLRRRRPTGMPLGSRELRRDVRRRARWPSSKVFTCLIVLSESNWPLAYWLWFSLRRSSASQFSPRFIRERGDSEGAGYSRTTIEQRYSIAADSDWISKGSTWTKDLGVPLQANPAQQREPP